MYMISWMAIWYWVTNLCALPWGRIFSALSILQLLIVLCGGLRHPMWALHCQSLSMPMLACLLFCPCSANTWIVMLVRLSECSITFDIPRKHYFTANSLVLCLSQPIWLPLLLLFLLQVQELFCKCNHWNCALQLCIFISWGVL